MMAMMMLVYNALNSALYNVSKRTTDSVFSVQVVREHIRKVRLDEQKLTHVDVDESEFCGTRCLPFFIIVFFLYLSLTF